MGGVTRDALERVDGDREATLELLTRLVEHGLFGLDDPARRRRTVDPVHAADLLGRNAIDDMQAKDRAFARRERRQLRLERVEERLLQISRRCTCDPAILVGLERDEVARFGDDLPLPALAIRGPTHREDHHERAQRTSALVARQERGLTGLAVEQCEPQVRGHVLDEVILGAHALNGARDIGEHGALQRDPRRRVAVQAGASEVDVFVQLPGRPPLLDERGEVIERQVDSGPRRATALEGHLESVTTQPRWALCVSHGEELSVAESSPCRSGCSDLKAEEL